MATHRPTLVLLLLFSCVITHSQTPPPVIPKATPTPPASNAEGAKTRSPTDAEPIPEKPATPETEPAPDSVLFPPVLPGDKPQIPLRMTPKVQPVQPVAEPEPEVPSEPDELKPYQTPELNPVFVESERFRKRFAMDQALGTGETLLGDLSGVRGLLNSPFATPTQPEGRALRLGPIDLRPRISVGVAFTHRKSGASGETGEPGSVEEGADAFFQAGLLAMYQRGQFSGLLGYAVGLTPQAGGGQRSESGQSNRLSQNLSITTSFRLEQAPRIRFGFGLNFADLSGVNRDVGGSTERTIATASLGASYEYSRKTTFDLDLSVPVRNFSGGISSSGSSISLFVNNQITRKTQVGLGVTYGTLESQVSGDSAQNRSSAGRDHSNMDGASQTFERLLLRADSAPTQKLSFNLTTGLELRGADGGYSALTPTFGLGAVWKPGPGTSVSLAAERRGFGSASALNTNYTSTSAVLTIKQRLGYRLNGYLSLGYEHATYYSVGEGGQNGRKDDLLHTELGLSLPITARWSWEVIFTASDNRSNSSPFRYYQGVLQTSYAF